MSSLMGEAGKQQMAIGNRMHERTKYVGVLSGQRKCLSFVFVFSLFSFPLSPSLSPDKASERPMLIVTFFYSARITFEFLTMSYGKVLLEHNLGKFG